MKSVSVCQQSVCITKLKHLSVSTVVFIRKKKRSVSVSTVVCITKLKDLCVSSCVYH